MFAPEKKLLGAKLNKSMDCYYVYAPGTTKIINSKPLPDLDLEDVDDNCTGFPVSTKQKYLMFSLMWKIKYLLLVMIIIQKNIYHILYEDGDTEDFYYIEVRDL